MEKQLQHKNSNSSNTSTTNCITQTTQIDDLTGSHPPSSMDTVNASGLLQTSYNMRHKYNGKAIIFKQKHFTFIDINPRDETDLDCLNLEASLKRLGFNVTTYEDLTLSELDRKIKFWAKKDYTNYDCFLMVVLTQGDQTILYAKDGGYVPESYLWGPFIGNKCVTLIGKPKIFFIQVYHEKEFDDSSPFKMSHDADFLIVHSVTPGFCSWFTKQKGSWNIQALCDIFDRCGFQDNILTLLTLMNRQVSINYEFNVPMSIKIQHKKPIPLIISTLTRVVKFEKKN